MQSNARRSVFLRSGFSRSGFPRSEFRPLATALAGLFWCAALAVGAPVLSQSANSTPQTDPEGDLIDAGPDIVSLSVQHPTTGEASEGTESTALQLRLRLASAPADPSQLFGFIDLDADGNGSTGSESSVDFLTRGTPHAQAVHEQAAFGSDLRLDLAGWTPDDPALDLVDETSGATLSRVPATWSGAELALSVPSAALPESLALNFGTAPIRATAAIGSAEALSDVAPNQGHVASEAGTGTELRDGRFVVSVSWRDFQGNVGDGTVVTQSEDSALYWFFQPSNWELLVKVLDGCGINQHQWVFVAATTNVEFTLRVHDRDTGLERSYFNPLGTAAPAINDIEAFASCAP